MDNVTVRASVAAAGLAKGATVTVAETPMVRGAIDSGVFTLIERHSVTVPASHPETSQGVPAETDETTPPAPEWYACPACQVERTDYEGPDGQHLPTCPNCGSDAVPVRSELPFPGSETSQPETAADGSTVVSEHLPGTSPRG
jgi:hypothetical protein